MRKVLLILLLSLPTLVTNAQNISVKGCVTDASDGSILPGVAVIQKDGNATAITDTEGRYTITVPSGAVLVFKCLGMVDLEQSVNGRRTIDVAMATDVTLLEDVLVVAYGTTTKESFTGSAEKVDSKKIKDRPVSNITKLLDGQVSGVMATSGSGQPGSGSSIIIRGFGSINASNNPLIVVDGVPYDGELASINAADIEGISVLKDASAGALYGARGANGVVMITTKKGASEGDKVVLSFSARGGVNSRAIPFYETVDSHQYMELMYNACYNDLVFTEGYQPAVARELTPNRLSSQILGKDNIYNPFDKDVNALFDEDGHIVADARLKYDENWLDEATNPLPIRQEYQFSASGSSDMGKYMASIGYLDEKGTLKTTGFKRFTARVNTDFSPRKWLDFGVNLNYAYMNSDFLGATGSTNSNVWYSAMLVAPIYPLYEKNPDGSDKLDTEGKRIFDYGSSRPAGAQNNRNSVATLYDDDYYTLSDQVNARAYGALKFGDFTITTNFGLDLSEAHQTTNYNRKSGNAAGTGRLTKEESRTMSYTWNQFINYKKSFGLHNIDAMAGHEFYNYNMRYLVGERTGFPLDEYNELGLGSTLAEANSAADNYSINSYLFRANYGYNDRYYASVSLREDASSRFKKENRWGTFWSAGASWRISREDWLKNLSWINNITIKASYGVQGNDNLGSYYAWQSLYDMNYPNASYSGAVIASIENSDVTWEKNGNLNTGVEIRLFNRLSGTVEWYRRKTTDLLLEYPMSISLGFPGYYANVGSMVNSGFDITVSGDIISRQNTFLNVTLMASTVRNRVLSLTGNGEDIVSGNYLIREGEAINTFYMARSAGVDPATGEQLYLAYEKDKSGALIPGSEYTTNDATVASGCKWLLGSRMPKVYGSLNTSFKLYSFDLSLMLTYSLGGKIYDSTYASMMEPSFVGQVYHSNSLRAWHNAGDVTDVHRITTTATSISNDRYLVDASYLGVKSFTAGYNFSRKLFGENSIKSLRVYISGDNLYTLCSMKGLNPQSSFNGSTSFSYTPNRTVTLGVDIKF